MAESSVAAVQVRGVLVHDEELAAGGVRIHRAGHADDAAGVLDGVGNAVLQKLTLDVPARAAHAGALGVASLDHEAGNNAVERQAVVKTVLDELFKVLAGDGGGAVVQLNVNGLAVLHGDTDHTEISFSVVVFCASGSLSGVGMPCK